MPPTMKSKSVASFEKINMEHDITICDFADWRDNMDFYGDFDVPISVSKVPSKVI